MQKHGICCKSLFNWRLVQPRIQVLFHPPESPAESWIILSKFCFRLCHSMIGLWQLQRLFATTGLLPLARLVCRPRSPPVRVHAQLADAVAKVNFTRAHGTQSRYPRPCTLHSRDDSHGHVSCRLDVFSCPRYETGQDQSLAAENVPVLIMHS